MPETKDIQFLQDHPVARIAVGVAAIGAGVGLAFLGLPEL